MKKRISALAVGLMLTIPTFGQLVVTDPDALAESIIEDAHRSAEHMESIKEVLLQSKIFVEDWNMKAEEYKRTMDLYTENLEKGIEAVMKVKQLFQLVSDIMDRFEGLKKQLAKNSDLNKSEKVIVLAEASSVVNVIISNKQELEEQAKKESNVKEKDNANEKLDRLDRLIEAVNSVDVALIRVINHANAMIAAKRRLENSSRAMVSMFSISYK